MSPTAKRRLLIPKHSLNVKTLPSAIANWERKGNLEQAERARGIYAYSRAELRSLGVKVHGVVP